MSRPPVISRFPVSTISSWEEATPSYTTAEIPCASCRQMRLELRQAKAGTKASRHAHILTHAQTQNVYIGRSVRTLWILPALWGNKVTAHPQKQSPNPNHDLKPNDNDVARTCTYQGPEYPSGGSRRNQQPQYRLAKPAFHLGITPKRDLGQFACCYETWRDWLGALVINSRM